jgi:hypothetical protein
MKRLILTVAAALALALPVVAFGAPGQPISFWQSVAATVKGPGLPTLQPVVKPSVIALFADGSWAVDHLRWTGWGSSVARATGISSASNGIPNQAQGKRIERPAQMVLSSPGRFAGHEVYRCYQLTIPSYPASDQHRCLSATGGYWYFTSSAPTRSRPAAIEFYAGGPLRGIACEMDAGGSLVPPSTGRVLCEDQTAGLSQSATLAASGRVVICIQHREGGCNPGNVGEHTPTFNPGRHETIGRYRCDVLTSGVRCVVIASGKGFLMGLTQTVRVG